MPQICKISPRSALSIGEIMALRRPLSWFQGAVSTSTTTILLAKEIYNRFIECIMAGCQVGRSPSVMAAYNCVSIIVDAIQIKKRIKRTKKNITCNSTVVPHVQNAHNFQQKVHEL